RPFGADAGLLLRPRAAGDVARQHARVVRGAPASGPFLRRRPDRVGTAAARQLLCTGHAVRRGLCGDAADAERRHLSPPRIRVSALRYRLAAIFAVTLVVFAPTLRNGFLPLGFDDALILDTTALRALNWENLRTLATQYNHAHFVPLTLLSLA